MLNYQHWVRGLLYVVFVGTLIVDRTKIHGMFKKQIGISVSLGFLGKGNSMLYINFINDIDLEFGICLKLEWFDFFSRILFDFDNLPNKKI